MPDRFALAAAFLAAFTVASGALAQPSSPLDRCYGEAKRRLDVGPCLAKLLDQAEAKLEDALALAKRDARELDAVIGPRARNMEKLAASHEAWSRYREAECARRAEAMSPGTGSGDVQLACLVELTERRAAELPM